MGKLLELMPRLSSCKTVELIKILQSTLRQSSMLPLTLPQQVSIQMHSTNNSMLPLTRV